MSIEPLLVRMRNLIEGWDLPFSGMSLCAYADDIVALIKGQKDLEVLQSIIKDFSLISSAKVNWTKSEAIAFGDWEKGLPTLPAGLSWNKKGFKYLGVYLGNYEMLQKNWEGSLEKMQGRLEKWRWLLPKLSYRGRT